MTRVLVVDDDEQMREMLAELLADEGYDVTKASDGEQAVALLREQPADLLITDIIMPNQEGVETIRIVASDFPEIKIIAISGGGRLGPDSFLPAAEKFGAHRVFAKPFDPDDLLVTVKELVEA